MTRDEKLKILKGDTAEPPTREEAIAILKGDQPQESENKGFLKELDEFLMAGAQGIVKGAVSLPGLPGDIQQLSAKIPVQYKANPAVASMLWGFDALPQLPTSGDVLGAYERNVHPFNKVEGADAYAERMGEFFTPMPGGKGNLARDAATAILGGGGSKGFEDIANKFNLSPEWASMLGGILGVTAGQFKRPNAVKTAAKDAPSREQLATQTDVDYKIAEAETNLDKQAFANAVNDIETEMHKKASRRADEPELATMIEEQLANPQMDFVHLDSLAQRAGTAAVSDDKNTRKFGKIVQRHIANYYAELEKTRPGITQKVIDAKGLGRSELLSEQVAERRSPSALAKLSPEIKEMDNVRSWANDQWKGLTPLEKQAAARATGRMSAQSPLRVLGRSLRGGPAMIAQLGATLTAPWTGGGAEQVFLAGGSHGLGIAAEEFADALSRNRLDDLEKVLRVGRKDQAKILAKANKMTEDIRQSGFRGVLGAVRSQQAEQYERRKNNKTKKKASLPEVELPVVKNWPIQGD